MVYMARRQREPSRRVGGMLNKLEASNMRFSSWMSPEHIMSTVNEYIRVLKFARKPTKEEFYAISKVAAAGIVLIGIIGFVIYLLLTLLPRYG